MKVPRGALRSKSIYRKLSGIWSFRGIYNSFAEWLAEGTLTGYWYYTFTHYDSFVNQKSSCNGMCADLPELHGSSGDHLDAVAELEEMNTLLWVLIFNLFLLM